tara:strand:- start:109 stop:279 length:171 start_codon:yes stop_codon:yes gene_type:complete
MHLLERKMKNLIKAAMKSSFKAHMKTKQKSITSNGINTHNKVASKILIFTGFKKEF